MENGFSVMVFHYDGVVDEWRDIEWSSRVIHVSAINQTKWWFAKRFLHPDIVAEYDYIFLWDEDLDVHDFDPGRYLSIVKEEGLEISQPALGPGKVRVHHQITVRLMNSKVHSCIGSFGVHLSCSLYRWNPLLNVLQLQNFGEGECYVRTQLLGSCIGSFGVHLSCSLYRRNPLDKYFNPIYSKLNFDNFEKFPFSDVAFIGELRLLLDSSEGSIKMAVEGAMITAQLLHVWGRVSQPLWVEIMAPVFSRAAWRCTWYMIQGDRTKNIGVVDSEFIVHLGLPTLGVSDGNKTITENLLSLKLQDLHRVDARTEVRKQSVFEMQTFKSRWNNAVDEDKCWVDPYPKPANQTIH
ncbi:hypothetical protein TEA_029082 [Camellia sinensis var. sinensis]|uniref:Uncharacterized protein n=1 Tax=Camellia sinensis var. sinensis TaxID=542762 RepID=A0A4S4DTJ4_CAMSN|nr:hypothetical protein TEA_029082 [Camellia sinensis var. sinensis]